MFQSINQGAFQKLFHQTLFLSSENTLISYINHNYKFKKERLIIAYVKKIRQYKLPMLGQYTD